MEKLTYKNDLPDIAIGEQDTHRAKAYQFRPVQEALIVGLTILACILSTTYFLYTHAIAAQKGEIQDGILRTALLLSNQVDGDLHQTFTSEGQESTASYETAIAPLALALETDDSIEYLYTMIMKDDKVYFILDPTPPGDSDDDGIEDKSYIMEEYTEANEHLLSAFKEETSVVESEITHDKWGSFLSGYAPIYDSEERMVAVLGVDISAKNYIERLAPIKRATVRAMVTGFFIAFVVGSLVWFMRQFSKVINDRRVRLLHHVDSVQEQPDD